MINEQYRQMLIYACKGYLETKIELETDEYMKQLYETMLKGIQLMISELNDEQYEH